MSKILRRSMAPLRRSRSSGGQLDFLVHAIAFSDKNELKGRYADTTRTNFLRTMLISCFSFTEVAKRAAALMPAGGAMVTLTYNGGQRAMPNYNVMGVAKAALEASVRYLAVDFGAPRIRVNAISAGPIRTLAGAGIADARKMFSVSAASFAAAPRRHARRDRRRCALPPLGSLDRRHRRHPLRRFRLQHHHHAAAVDADQRQRGRRSQTANSAVKDAAQ